MGREGKGRGRRPPRAATGPERTGEEEKKPEPEQTGRGSSPRRRCEEASSAPRRTAPRRAECLLRELQLPHGGHGAKPDLARSTPGPCLKGEEARPEAPDFGGEERRDRRVTFLFPLGQPGADRQAPDTPSARCGSVLGPTYLSI